MARTIQRLVSAGYAWRETDVSDERAYRVMLTSKAWEDRDVVRSALQGWTRKATRGFSDEEFAVLHDLLVRMVNNAAAEEELT